jgi:tripartite ATP-independent transporter DctM subunit
MSVLLMGAIAFIVLITLVLLGCPIFFALGFTGLAGLFISSGDTGLAMVAQRMFGTLNSFSLMAAPLFILMGNLIFASGIGKDLYDTFGKWLRGLPGGLIVASIIANIFFGAMCGVSIAAVATFGAVAMPELEKKGYDKELCAGAICSSGALSMLIPPSLMFILYGEVANVSVGALFAGGIVPGVILGLMMALYVIIRVLRNPQLAPTEETVSWLDKWKSLGRVWPAIVVILSVLVTIYMGIATPTEAAAVGVIVSYLLGRFYYRTLGQGELKKVLKDTALTSGSILVLVAGASIFTGFLNIIRFQEILTGLIVASGISGIQFVIIMMFFLIFLGCFVDASSVVLVTTPIVIPIILAFGLDPLWYGVLVVINTELAVITPPVGLNLYTLNSVRPELGIELIIKGTMPYYFIELACLFIFIFFPILATWLPGLM